MFDFPTVLTGSDSADTDTVRGTPLSARRWQVARLAVMLGGIGAAIALYQLNAGVQDALSRALAVLATGDGAAIGAYLQGFGIWAPVASLGLMVVQAVAAPVPAILVAFANGLAFGVFWGGLLTIAGQTLAAAVCFGLARALGRGPVEALAGKLGLETADRWLSQRGARGIFLLRLAPQAFLYAYLIRESPQSAWLFFLGTWLVIGVLGSAAFVRRKRNEEGAGSPARVRDAAAAALDFPSSPTLLPMRGEKGVVPGGIAACVDAGTPAGRSRVNAEAR